MAFKTAVRLQKLTCVRDSGDLVEGDDEPYIVSFTALLGSQRGIANTTEVAQSMRAGRTHTFHSGTHLWGIFDRSGSRQEITDLSDVVILIALMERDGVSSVNINRALLQATGASALNGKLTSKRDDNVATLKREMRSALALAAKTGGLHADDILGPVQELVLADLGLELGTTVVKTLEFDDAGHSDALYHLDVEVSSVES